jgi:S-adenosylmethionine/arginine decarboxylase-like enzyme
MEYILKHLVIDLYGCDDDRVQDQNYIEKIIKESVILSGAKSYSVYPDPKKLFIAIDIYFDNTDADSEKALSHLIRKFGATKYSANEIKRGVQNETI